MSMNTDIQTVDEYIATYPESTQKILKKIQATIKKLAPDAEEKIGYGIPTYKVNGKNAVHFGGYDGHIGLYPGSVGVSEFTDQLKDYDTSKGTIRFPLDKPIPYDLIEQIAAYCINRLK